MDDFLQAIDTAYQQHDSDCEHLEQSLDATSRELLQRNEELSSRLTRTAESHNQLEQLFSIINATLQASQDGILLMDEDGYPIIFNQRAAELLDTTQDFIGRATCADILQLLQRKARNTDAFSAQLTAIEQDPLTTTSGTLELNNGTVVEIYSHPRLQDGEVMGRAWTLHDISELRNSEREMRHRAYHDPLTDLPNRDLFTDRITHALSRYQREQHELALLFIDLDGFKCVNDTLGHETGDQLLVEVAERLVKVVREQDTIARHGGDEFLVLLENVDSAQHVREVSQRILDALTEAFVYHEQDICISASIGITLAPADGSDPERLIRNADMAMYRAKQAGRNNYQFFQPDMAESSIRQLCLQNQIHQGLRNNEFILHYQPKIDLHSGKIAGAEALIRWAHDDKLVAPGEFISAAEKNGQIVPLSEWMLDTACQQLKAWRPLLPAGFVLSVNLSTIHFRQKNLIEYLSKTLEKYQLPAHCLDLELTESVVLDSPERSIDKLQQLRDIGLHLSIDDFGTGYSSFNYLKNMPVDTVKIDRSFIQGIDHSQRDLSLVESIIDIAHTLEMKVVAEGIETLASHQRLLDIGCDQAQGYHYHRPMSVRRFTQTLQQLPPRKQPHSPPSPKTAPAL